MERLQPWWRTAAVYQVYIRSFADGNADGTGDIAGLRSRLPYLESLGVDALWINPWYESPLLDGGYDVADYRKIHHDFGTNDEAFEFIAEAARHGIRVIVDLVPNHTSWEHRWFRAALDAGPGSPERDRYHFRQGRGPDGSIPPTDWRSVFGGPAWSRVDGEWYLHLFDPSQPDLNWDNPEVREEFESILRYWLDHGAAGFRVDVAHALAKDQSYPDVGDPEAESALLSASAVSNHPFWDRPELHEIVREWRQVLDSYDDVMMVAEAWVENWDRLSMYLRRDEYHQAFEFDLLLSPWDSKAMREAIDISIKGAAEVHAVPTWVLSNHDVIRHATRYGLPQGADAKQWLLDGDRSLLDLDLGLRRARAATLALFALPGSVYIYQGEELGLHEVVDLPTEVLQDPVWERSGHEEKGRDGCRAPIPWTVDGPSAGFGSDGAWLPQPEGWGLSSVEAQDGVTGSTLEMYRRALRLRCEHMVGDAAMTWVDHGRDVLAYRRSSGVTCMVNFGPASVDLPGGQVLIASGDVSDGRLRPDDAVWIRED